MYSIEIDFDVFKEITARRNTEDVTPNDVLREAFGLKTKKMDISQAATNLRPWVSKAVTFPHGTKFRARFKGNEYFATVDDGALLLNGKRYSSPSSAAVSITGHAVNGWVFWECQMPGTLSWKMIKKLRK